MFMETRPTPKISVARLARDSNIGGYTQINQNAITTSLFVFMCQVRIASFVTTFTVYFFAIGSVILTITW